MEDQHPENAKHRRPTTPFGHIEFRKDGGGRHVLAKLRETKEEQEFGLDQLVADALSQRCGRVLEELWPLDERGHDLGARECGDPIEIQVCEATLRGLPEIDPCDEHVTIIVNEPGTQRHINKDAYEALVATLIKGKVRKRYSTLGQKRLILLVADMTGTLLVSNSEAMLKARQAL